MSPHEMKTEYYKGPREALLTLIESYVDVVLEVDKVTVNELRR